MQLFRWLYRLLMIGVEPPPPPVERNLTPEQEAARLKASKEAMNVQASNLRGG